MGAGLTAAGTMVSATEPITLFQQPESPQLYVGYVPAGAGHLVTYADDPETLKDIFDHVTVSEIGPSARTSSFSRRCARATSGC